MFDTEVSLFYVKDYVLQASNREIRTIAKVGTFKL